MKFSWPDQGSCIVLAQLRPESKWQYAYMHAESKGYVTRGS